MTWILTLVLIHSASVDQSTVRGFASQADCEATGRAWAAQINHREGSTDMPVWSCKSKDPK